MASRGKNNPLDGDRARSLSDARLNCRERSTSVVLYPVALLLPADLQVRTEMAVGGRSPIRAALALLYLAKSSRLRDSAINDLGRLDAVRR